MIEEIELDKRIEEVLISDVYYREIIIEYFNYYCLQVFNRTYDYNLFNLKVFLLDLFRIEYEVGIFLFKIKGEVADNDKNFLYVSMLNITRLTNIDDFKIYIEKQLNYE